MEPKSSTGNDQSVFRIPKNIHWGDSSVGNMLARKVGGLSFLLSTHM